MKKLSELLQSLKKSQKETDKLYKPVFFRLKIAADREKFQKILSLPGIGVTDHIFDQIRELVKYKNPERKFSTKELELKTNEHIGGTELEHYGVWVFYPWSLRLVHILDEREFV